MKYTTKYLQVLLLQDPRILSNLWNITSMGPVEKQKMILLVR